MILEAMPVLEQQQPPLVDLVGADRGRGRLLAFGKGDEQPVVEQRPRRDLAAGIRQREQHAIGAAVVEPLRSEEHTSELQSLMRISYAVFCLKKKKIQKKQPRQKSSCRNT